MEGQPQIRPVLTEWFRCRLEPADTSARDDDGHWKRIARTWLICKKRDVKGHLLEILATDYIQIVSDDVDVGEDTIWEIDGDVTPMRKRKGVIGFEFKVKQVRERPTWMTSIPPGTP